MHVPRQFVADDVAFLQDKVSLTKILLRIDFYNLFIHIEMNDVNLILLN